MKNAPKSVRGISDQTGVVGDNPAAIWVCGGLHSMPDVAAQPGTWVIACDHFSPRHDLCFNSYKLHIA
jgi:hypothetical protein